MAKRSPWLLVGVAAVVVAAVAAAVMITNKDDAGDDFEGLRPVDFKGLRVMVPATFYVQDISDKVDGEFSCPVAEGYVFVDDGVQGNYPFCVGKQHRPTVWIYPVEYRGRRSFEIVNGVKVKFDGTQIVTPGQGFMVPVYLPDLELGLRFYAPAPSVEEAELAGRAIFQSFGRSPRTGLAVPTTATTVRAGVSARLAGQIGCEKPKKVGTYDLSPPRGLQAEAPLRCPGPARMAGRRIFVFRSNEGRDATLGVYAGMWIVYGDRWLITTWSEADAQTVAKLTQGETRAPNPDRCCGPPSSINLS